MMLLVRRLLLELFMSFICKLSYFWNISLSGFHCVACYVYYFCNRQVIGIDMDSESLEIASLNAEELEVLKLVGCFGKL